MNLVDQVNTQGFIKISRCLAKLTATAWIAGITESPVFDAFLIYFVFSDINFQITSVS